MGKPIRLTDEKIEAILTQTKAKLEDMQAKGDNMFEGELTFKLSSVLGTDERAHLIFSPEAYAKMFALVDNFSSEVAWHGTVQRDGLDFYIEDILVYPQKVTGVTVNTDQAEYDTWMMELDDDTFSSLRMQGHSHVNMGVSPSGVDTTHQKQILEQLKGTDFYIFMIVNKHRDMFITIFDLASNVKFETEDIDLYIGPSDFAQKEFVDEAKSLVTTGYTSYTSSVSKNSTDHIPRVYGYYQDDDPWDAYEEYMNGLTYGAKSISATGNKKSKKTKRK